MGHVSGANSTGLVGEAMRVFEGLALWDNHDDF